MLGAGQEEVFLGRDFGHTKEYSEETAAVIDEETKRIIDTGYERAKNLLTEHIGLYEKYGWEFLYGSRPNMSRMYAHRA